MVFFGPNGFRIIIIIIKIFSGTPNLFYTRALWSAIPFLRKPGASIFLRIVVTDCMLNRLFAYSDLWHLRKI